MYYNKFSLYFIVIGFYNFQIYKIFLKIFHHQQYTFESKKNDFHNKYNYYNPIIIIYTASDIDLEMDYNQLQDNIIL